jgi:CBS domain-containing protein
MDNQALEFMSKIEPFSRLPRDELQKAVSQMSVIRYPKGTVLAVQGKTTLEKILIINSGTLELYFESQGRKMFSGLLKAGDIFGGMSILMNSGLSIRSVSVEEDACFYKLSKKHFLKICRRHRLFYDYFADAFGARMADESYAAVIAASQMVHFLSGVAPFSFLPPEELHNFASQISTVHHPKDTVVFVQGESRVDGLYILQKGAAERYFEDDNQKNLRGVLGEGETFGGISMLLNDLIAVRTLRTTEDTYFYKLPQDVFFEICKHHEAFADFFTDTFGKRMMDRYYAAIIAKSHPQRLENLQLFNQPVASICSKNVTACDKDVSIQNAAEMMSRRSHSSIFIREPGGDIIGVATDNDLRTKVIAKGYDARRPVAEIMSSPLRTIPENALIFEALMAMMQQNIKHIAVTDPNMKVVGVLTNQDLLMAQGQSPVFLIREISSATGPEGIVHQHKRLPRLIQNLVNAGAPAKNINRFITTISDAILRKLIEFTLEELGPPPAKFVFMILGSEGRKEQTLKTDQDNAIVFEDVPPDSEASVKAYFLRFADKVCAWLDQAGYAFCQGNIMAKNPKLCQPLAVWKEYFSNWIHSANPEDLLYSSIFFDFRGAYGDMGLIRELRDDLFKTLVGWSGFFRNLTENALHFKAPIGFFRNFVVESKGEHRNKFDIKRAMMPIVDYARIYALKNNLEETNTLERLYQLSLKNAIPAKDYQEIEQAYSFLMQMRLLRQVTAVLDEGAVPDNYINPKELLGIEQKLLKEIFIRIENLQTKLSFEFTGQP